LLLAALIAGFFWPIAELAALLLAATNLIIVSTKGGYIAKSSAIADKISKVLSGYSVVFDKIEKEDWQATKNVALTAKIKENQTSKNIAGLAKLIDKLSYNLIMVVNFVLERFFLWALKQTIAIEQWKRNNHENLEDAFDVIAEFEALASIAGLEFNYPQWSTPQIEDGEAYTLGSESYRPPAYQQQKPGY
jgi:predicted house-cleaning noncanonical NTP pyrophosphatase (MazG superfamily)